MYMDIKKKKLGRLQKLLIVAVLILIILFIIGMFSESDDENVSSDMEKTTINSEKNDVLSEPRDVEGVQGNEKELMSESETQVGKTMDERYRIGDSVKFTKNDGSGEITVTIEDWGYKYDSGIYITYEIENTGNTEMEVDESIFDVYADDYGLSLLDGENSLYYKNLAPGRKARGTLYVESEHYQQYKTIEVDCSGYVYLIWDGRFIDDFIGTYTWQEGDSGANIIIKQMYAEYTRQRYLVISGECWCGNERGIFESKMSVLGYEPYYDSVTGFGYLEFVDDRNQSLEAYKTDDDGILIRQIGTIEDGNYNKVAKASFNGTYYAGLTDRAQTVIDEMPVSGDDYRYKLVAQYGNFTMSDLGFNDNDLNFYWEEGNNEDATGADIFIYYDENWETVRMTGIWWSSVDERDFDCVVKEVSDENTFTVTDGVGTTMFIQVLDEGIHVEQIEGSEDIGEIFEGTYQRR